MGLKSDSINGDYYNKIIYFYKLPVVMALTLNGPPA